MMQRSTVFAWCIFAASLVNVALFGWFVSLSPRIPLNFSISLVVSVGLALGTLTVAQGLGKTQKLANRTKADLTLAETRLQEQSQAIDFLADGLDLGIFICDATAVVTYCNRTAQEMFHFQSPIGRSIMAVTLSYDLEQLVLRVTQSHEVQNHEIVFSGANERVAMVKGWFNPQACQTFVAILDVTNLRRLERVRQDFVANVSHELRTPMAIIRAYAETLLDDADPDSIDLQNYLPKMIAEIDRLSGLTKDLLILSAAELDTVNKQLCNFSALCQATVIQLSGKAQEKGLVLTFEGDPEVWIEANSAQMTQVALNLVDNALNYTIKGSVSVRVTRAQEEAVLTVRDTGIGIGSDHTSRIFERFYRVDKGRSRSTGGTGLGLSIVRHIVEAHQGSVSVSSVLQQGSQFTVRLPARVG